MATIDLKLKTYDQLIFEITKLNTDIMLKDKEIERLNKENKELNKICARKSHYIDKKDLEITQKDLEIERLNNIRNKVREKIKSVDMLGLRSGKTFIATLLNDILEILDKGSDK